MGKERLLRRLSQENMYLSSKMSVLRSADPKTSLERGFSLVYLADKRLVRSFKQVQHGDDLKIYVSDGTITSRVHSMEEETSGEGQCD